jgi:hypothetical protein
VWSRRGGAGRVSEVEGGGSKQLAWAAGGRRGRGSRDRSLARLVAR